MRTWARLALVLALLVASSAQSATVTLYFRGTMTLSQVAGAPVGVPTSASVTYETTGTDSNPSPNFGFYTPAGVVHVIAGDQDIVTSGPLGLHVFYRYSPAAFDQVTWSGQPGPPYESGFPIAYALSVNAIDPAGATLPSDAIPPSAASVVAFPSFTATLTLHSLTGELLDTWLSADLVPIPSASTLGITDLATPGDGLVTRDTQTHLDWLRLTATSDLSWNDVQGGAGGWLAAGWRHATMAEVCALMVKLGEAPDPCPRPDYEDHAGNPFLPHYDFLGRVYTLPGYFTFSEGLFDDGNPDNPSVGFLGIYDEFSTGISRIQVAPDLILPHRHGAAAGHLLVRKTPECVDGIDNDHDGLVDGADPQCIAGAAVEQQALCGLGPELAVALIALAARRRGLGIRRSPQRT